MPKNFLKTIRTEKKISQSDLAKKIGVSKQLLSGFEQGRSGVSNEVLNKLGKELKVTPEYIITGKSKQAFDEKGKEKLAQAMNNVFSIYGDDFDKETIVKIATEVYGFMLDFDDLKEKSEKEDFKRSLENKIIEGLAAKCFLKNNK